MSRRWAGTEQGWLVAGSFLISAMAACGLLLARRGVSECSLIDSTHGHTQHTQGMSRSLSV